MTYRLSLILGLVIALPSAALPAARGADSSAQTVTPTNTAGVELSSWKRSDRAMSADIRFKKPEGIVFTDQQEEPENDSTTTAATAKPATAPATIAGPAAATATLQGPALRAGFATIAAPVRASIQTPSAAANTPITFAPTAANSAATTTAANLLAPPAAAPTTPIAAATAQAPSNASTVYNDDQIQLVAQLLMDKGVIRAADDEPLPASPNNGMSNGQANHPRNGRGNNPVDPATGECCYDDCNNCCPQPCLFWTAGVEATFLSPDLNEGTVTFATERTDPNGTDTFSVHSEDVDSLYMSPRIWLGVQGCAWGANLRYWHLQASEGGYDPSIGGAGTWNDYDCGRPDVGFFSCSSIEAYTVDLELTRRFCLHDCWMQASVGVRHAELWTDEGITGLAVTDEGLLNGFGRSNRNSRGTGILLGLYGRKPLFPCSCVNWFYNARWSALWGPTQTSVETFAAVQSDDPNFTASAASVNGAYTTIDDTMFIGEIQLGLEWDYCLCCLPANAFFRAAIEYQRWDGGQGFSASDSFAGITIQQQTDPTSIVSTSAVADEPQLDLFGFTIGTGLTW